MLYWGAASMGGVVRLRASRRKTLVRPLLSHVKNSECPNRGYMVGPAIGKADGGLSP